MSQQSSGKPALLLIAGAVLGAVLAASGMLETAHLRQGDVVASVNGEKISRSQYLANVRLLARERRKPMTTADHRRILERMIEERLLLNRGLAIDLPYSDARVRKAIVNAMVETVTSQASSADPAQDELADFYMANQGYFTREARVQVRRMVFRGEGALERATSSHADLAGKTWSTVASATADSALPPLPTGWLPASRLRDYLGPTQSEAVLSLPVGAYSEPMEEQGGYVILQLVQLQPGSLPPLEKVDEQVRAEYRRRAGERALREYLQQLRNSADIEIDEAFIKRLSLAGNSGD